VQSKQINYCNFAGIIVTIKTKADERVHAIKEKNAVLVASLNLAEETIKQQQEGELYAGDISDTFPDMLKKLIWKALTRKSCSLLSLVITSVVMVRSLPMK